MNKAKVTTLEEMSEAQAKEDNAMTPLARLELAFQLAEFALELNPQERPPVDSSLPWIELHKIPD